MRDIDVQFTAGLGSAAQSCRMRIRSRISKSKKKLRYIVNVLGYFVRFAVIVVIVLKNRARCKIGEKRADYTDGCFRTWYRIRVDD